MPESVVTIDRNTQQTDALTEIIAPAVMHFGRTDSLAERYKITLRYGEALLLRESNSTMRALLLTKSHLLPSSLVQPSQCLLSHYDIWLKRFDLTLTAYRAAHMNLDPSPGERFDVGYSVMESLHCGGFPKEVPDAFKREFNELRRALFNMPPTPDTLRPSLLEQENPHVNDYLRGTAQ